LKADFANRYLGGGALGSGCVQEEIMFANHPELFTAQLLCEVMKPNECIFLSGFKKYFSNSGYGFSTSFRGFETHKYAYDAKGMAREYITAIDAQPFG
jgi:poly(ADP-ribose) glycohydrolase